MSRAGCIRATLQAPKIILQMKYIKQGYEYGMGETWFSECLACKYFSAVNNKCVCKSLLSSKSFLQAGHWVCAMAFSCTDLLSGLL